MAGVLLTLLAHRMLHCASTPDALSCPFHTVSFALLVSPVSIETLDQVALLWEDTHGSCHVLCATRVFN